MKYLVLLSAFMISCITGYGQTHYEKKFIRSAISRDSIVYPAKVPSYWVGDVKEALVKDTLFDWKYAPRYEKFGLPDSLIFVLTKEEKEYIIHEFEVMKNFEWKDNVVKHSSVIDFEKLKTYKKEHGGKSNYNRNDSYMFSRPIFIRDKRVCFFYVQHCGTDYFKLYVRKKGKWEQKFILLFGILD